MKRDGPGTRKKSQKRCRGRVSPAGQSNGLQDGKNDLEVAGVGASCSGAGYQIQPCMTIDFGVDLRDECDTKRNSLFDAICAEMWVGDLGYVEIEESVCCYHHYPLNHPHPKGVADVVIFLRWKKSTGRFQALSPWSVHVLVQEAQVFHGHLRTVEGEVSGYSEDGQCMFMVQVGCR